MVKSVLGVNHQGVRDWLMQRMTAILMVAGVIALIGYLIMHPGLSYMDWHDLFTKGWVKVAALLFILSVLYHAWLGIWIVLTDYVKLFVLRLALELIFLLALITCFLAGLLIVWGI